jgi:hypothetical protein
MQKPGGLAGLLVLITILIIRDGGKLVCQLFFGGKLLILGLLLGNWRVEGLDNRICGIGQESGWERAG